MSGTTTPRLGMSYVTAQQSQPEVTLAATQNRLDALVQGVVQQVGLNTPPGSPADGQCWIVGASPTGAWSAQANNLAQWIGGAWAFITRFVGLMAFDVATSAEWAWNGTAWVLLSPRVIDASATYDPPSLADGAGATTTVTATGAALGDFVRASFSLDLQGITVTAWVSGANVASVRFQNESGGTLDLGSGTLRVRVEKP